MPKKTKKPRIVRFKSLAEADEMDLFYELHKGRQEGIL